MTEAGTTLVILALAVVAFMTNRVPAGLVALGVSLALLATGVIDLDQTFVGFGDPAVVLIAALFVVAEGLDASGLTAWVGRLLVSNGGSLRRLTTMLMLAVALLSALISVNGAVAALLPVGVVMAARVKTRPSRLLMPLAFGAHAGALLTLTGSPVSVLLSEYAAEKTGRGFGFFEFTIVGVPLVVGTVLITVFFGRRLVPDRTPVSMPKDLSDQARVLLSGYPALAERRIDVFDAATGIAEVMVPPRSALIGQRVFSGMLTDSGDLMIVAVQRGGEPIEAASVRLREGDVLALEGSWSDLETNLADPAVLVVDDPDAVRRQAAPLGPHAWIAVGIMAAMVVLLATGLVAPAVTGVLAAAAMVLTGVVPVQRAHRSINWTTLLLVAGMIPLSGAITRTGAAASIANGLLGAIGDDAPTLALLGLCIVALVFGQLISNTATALVIAPIAVQVATQLHVSPLPFLMATAVVCAAAFLTPIATPANFLVMAPAGYRFGDYWKLGLPLVLLFLAVAVFLVPVFWPF